MDISVNPHYAVMVEASGEIIAKAKSEYEAQLIMCKCLLKKQNRGKIIIVLCPE